MDSSSLTLIGEKDDIEAVSSIGTGVSNLNSKLVSVSTAPATKHKLD